MIKKLFDQIRQINAHGQEFWNARELMAPLGYLEWRKFEGVIRKAKESCKNSGQNRDDHFVGTAKMIKIASGTAKEAFREVDDYHLSRYACYLIAQNGDPRKEEIALAQTYFAFQTRKQEMSELFLEDSERVLLRGEMSERNKKLAKAAHGAGVINHANFQDFGYMGLYGGLRQRDIHVKKKLKPNEKILDHMGSEELGANIFRATQAAAKLKRENIIGQSHANKAHYDVGKKVRKTIQELGGTMPEKLKTPANIKEAQQRLKVRGKELL